MRNQHDLRTRSSSIKALALAATLALVGAACGSDAPEATAGVVTTEAAVSTSASDVSETVPPTAVAAPFDIEMSATIDFEQGDGAWQITSGAEALGCEGGTFTEGGFAAGAERTMTCDDGPGTGTIVLRFAPELVQEDPVEFASDWTVHAATGDFAGLEGGGAFSGLMNEEETGGNETWTGSIEFGEAVDAAETTDGDPGGAELSEAFLVSLMDRLDVPEGADGMVGVSVIDADGVSISAAGGNDPDGSSLGPSDPVRVGSITKVFTSLTTLALVSDGAIDLDDLASQHVSRVVVPEGVTVRDLLQHTSGIPEHVMVDGFLEGVFADDARVWTPEEAIELVAEMDVEFAPGEEFSYSNTNYIILGMLIEEVAGQPAHEVIRERVIDVVGMPNTYLDGFEDGPAPVAGFTDLAGDGPIEQIDFDYTSIATVAWTAGSMVSTGDDLHRLFTAVVAGDIVPAPLVEQMIANEDYGLGVIPWDDNDSLIGHGGSIFGYETLVFHDPVAGQTAFWASTNSNLSFGPIVEDTVLAMVPDLATDSEG